MERAGEIQGIATLTTDVSRLGQALYDRLGREQIDYKPEQYEAVIRKLHGAKGKSKMELSGDEIAQFVTGIALEATDAITRAKQLAHIRVRSEKQRSEIHSAQAAIIDPARLMWKQANDVLLNMEPRDKGASGLGNPVIIAAVIIGGAIIYGVAIAAIVAAITYLIDTRQRLQWAEDRAKEICENAEPKCTPEQYTKIQKELSESSLKHTPWNRAASEFGKSAGKGLMIGAAIAGSAAAIAIGWFVWDSFGRDKQEG